MIDEELQKALKKSEADQGAKNVLATLIDHFVDEGFQRENVYDNRAAEDARLIADFLKIMIGRIY